MTASPGDRLGERYEVLARHSGGMGVVFVVRDLESGARYAAKTVKEELRSDPRVLGRFEREVRTWIRLGRHENLVQALFFREVDGAPFLFLEFVEGPTLASLLRADGPLLLVQALDIALMCAHGLAHAHERALGEGFAGLVHRDVKPENVFLTRDRLAKVSDLGIAKVLSADLDATAEGVGMGTPFYVSPEQLKGARDVDARADVYSFGAVLHEMLTGRVPLQADSLESQIYQILRVRAAPPSARRPGLPPALDDLVLRCLEKDPAARPPDFRALSEELAAILADPGLAAIEAPHASCATCGYASLHEPEKCPICDAAMGPPLPFRPRSVVTAPPRSEVPARLAVTAAEVCPRPARVGEELAVGVTLENRGTVPARHCVLTYVSPDRDVFRLIGPDDAWRGEVPPTSPGRPLHVNYRLMPLREGAFSLPPPEVSYEARGGRRETAAFPEPVRFAVTFNYRLPLTGREGALRDTLDLLARRQPAFVLVEGEAGSGRTRFLEEVAARLREDGWQTFDGKALERAREPMKLFHDVARHVFDVGREPLSGSALMARIIDRLEPPLNEDPGLAGYFAAFLRGTDLPEAQAAIQGYLWFRLLGSLAQSGPVALVLDDLQWATVESIDLAETLVRRAREEGVPIAVVGATLTTDPAERTRLTIAHVRERFSSLATNPGLTRRVRLEPLDSEEDVKAVLAHVFPGNTLGEDHPWLVPALVAQSGGNPFHLLQVLKLLREARDEAGEPLVSAEGGSWTLRPELDEARLKEWIPEAVEDMVRAILTPLQDDIREVLDAAAIIGEEFDVALLEELLGRGPDLDRRLDVLEQADLVRAADDAGERYRFTNSLVPAIIERGLQARSRRTHARLHRQVARALESTLGARGLRRAALPYARHLLLAGDKEKALRWHVIAAAGLVAQQLYLRADTLLTRAGRLIEEGVKAPAGVVGRYHFLRGEVFRVTGRLREALSAFDQAVEHFKGTRGQADLALALSLMGRVHEVQGEIDRATYCYQLGAQIREDIGDPAALSHSRNNLGALLRIRGREEEARKAFEEARGLAEKTGDLVALGNALDNLAQLAARRGEWERAEELYQESIALGTRIGDRLGVAQSLNGLGSLAFRRGDLDGAAEHYGKAIEIRREVGDREGTANVLSNLGVIKERRGEYEAALDHYRRSVEAHRAIGSRRGLATVLNNIGVLDLDRGDVSAAMSRFEEAVHIRREMGDRERLGNALLNLGEALAMAGRSEEGRRLLDEAHEVFEASDDAIGCASAHAARASLARRNGDLETAEREILAAVEHHVRDPRVRSQLHVELAEVHLARKDLDRAARAAERAQSFAEESGDRLGHAQTLRVAARIAREGGDPAGALDLLDRAESLLAGTSGPELMRVHLERGLSLGDTGDARAREVLMRARGLLDALKVRGAVLPERETIEALLGSGPSAR